MGLLHEAAARIVAHLRARAAGFHPIQAVLDRECARQQTALDAVNRRLVAGHVFQPEDAVHVIAPLEPYECADGTVQWVEHWVYPSTDLLMFQGGVFPYGQPEKAAPLPWEPRIQARLAAAGHWLAVAIAPRLPGWTQPRGQTLWLTPAAKQLGLQPRKWEQAYLQQFKEPHPDLGQRAWHIPVDAETIAVAEVLTHLVIVAGKQQFPVSPDDRDAALQWMQSVVQEGLRRLDVGESRQMSQDVLWDVFLHLVKEFDLPATPWGLQDYIKTTARGRVKDEKKKHAPQPHESWLDSATGEKRYPDAWAAQVIGKSEKTVTRWKAAHGITTEGLSETVLAAIRQEYEAKQQRKSLWERGKAGGMSDEGLKKLFQRKKKPDGTPDWEAIEAHIKRREKKAEAMALSEDTLTHEDQIAEWEARLAEAELGSDEWCDAQDALQRLQQPQRGSYT